MSFTKTRREGERAIESYSIDWDLNLKMLEGKNEQIKDFKKKQQF